MYRLYVLFFVSGAAGLIYQIVWSRLLQQVFGVTAYAVTTVLATFLGGLALGSWLLGQMADRSRHPLRLYGWLEIGIALTALVGSRLLGPLDALHDAVGGRLDAGAPTLVFTRVLLGALVILPPTILMGGTLPAITRFIVRGLDRLGRELGFLYALNTAGAVVGTLAAGFWLIRSLGVQRTLWLAVALNLLVGLAALTLARGSTGRYEPKQGRPVVTSASGGAGILLAIALSGVVALGLEVLWTRALLLVVGSSTYAFATMLAVFLIGITLGSLLVRGILDRRLDLRRIFGWVQLGIAVTALATLPLIGRVGDGSVVGWFRSFAGRWQGEILARFGLSAALMLVPTVLIGATFPLAAKIWTTRLERVGAQLGRLYGVNTLGNIVGAVLAGFVLLPYVGLRRGLALLVVLNLVAAAWGLLGAGRPLARAAAAVPLLACLALCLVLALIWRPAPLMPGASERNRILYYREGPVSTVWVIEDARDPRRRLMAVDAVKIGETIGGVDRKQQALAAMPFLLGDPAPRRVMSIGLGTGIVCGQMARQPSVDQVDCLELSPSVIEASRFFDDANGAVLEHPKIDVINDDGVRFLRRGGEPYDAIVSDAKSKTTHAGNALFFSTDYYRLCRERLSGDGLMIQWIPLHVPLEDLQTITRSFQSVFDLTYLWVLPPSAYLLVGAKHPLELNGPRMDRRLASPSMKRLRGYGWWDGLGVAAALVADPPALTGWLSGSRTINTLDRPLLEFYSPRLYAVPDERRVRENLVALGPLQSNRLAGMTLIGIDVEEFEQNRSAMRTGSLAFEALQRGDTDRGLQLLEQAVGRAPGNGLLRHAASGLCFDLARNRERRGEPERAARLFGLALRYRPDDPAAHRSLARVLAAMGQSEEARRHMQEAERIETD